MARQIAVIGGGVTGLVGALRLKQAGAEVTVLEASDRLGGKIRTSGLRDATIELGADSFFPRDDRPLQLCREVGILDELVSPEEFGAWIFRAGRLHRMPPDTVLGAPASLRTLASTRLLSLRGKARAAVDLVGTGPLKGGDVAVGAFIRSRLGAEVLDRMVDPLLAGTRAGDVEEMSLAAAIPLIDHAARTNRSLTRGLRRARHGSANAPRFYAPRTGMSRLIEALASSLEAADIVHNCRATAVEPASSGYTIHIEGDGAITADAVLITTPSYLTAQILRELSPEAAARLATIPHASAAVVNLLFSAGAVDVPSGGSGVLVPSSERMTLSGCTWFSSKWPAFAGSEGKTTIRCFVGRNQRDPALELDDEDLVGVILTELARVVTVHTGPLAQHIARWERALPQYKVGHLDTVAGIERSLATHRDVAVAGASFRGSGLPDCIAQAERAATALLETARR